MFVGLYQFSKLFESFATLLLMWWIFWRYLKILLFSLLSAFVNKRYRKSFAFFNFWNGQFILHSPMLRHKQDINNRKCLCSTEHRGYTSQKVLNPLILPKFADMNEYLIKLHARWLFGVALEMCRRASGLLCLRPIANDHHGVSNVMTDWLEAIFWKLLAWFVF